MTKYKVIYHFTSRTTLNRALKELNHYAIVRGLDLVTTQRAYNRNKFLNQATVCSSLY